MKIYGMGKRSKNGMVTGIKVKNGKTTVLYGKYKKVNMVDCAFCGKRFNNANSPGMVCSKCMKKSEEMF